MRYIAIILIFCAAAHATFVDWGSANSYDENSDITISTTTDPNDTLTSTTDWKPLEDSVYFYSDLGSGNIASGISIDFDAKADYNQDWARTGLCVFSSVNNETLEAQRTATRDYIYFGVRKSDTDFYFALRIVENGSEIDSNTVSITDNTQYYITLGYTDTTVTASVYTDDARTSLQGSMEATMSGTMDSTYQYLGGICTWQDTGLTLREMQVWTKEYDVTLPTEESTPTYFGGAMVIQ
jgi:hypothetical protein